MAERICFNISFPQWKKRRNAWRNYAKVKDDSPEFLKDFDKRVYLLGLKALKYERILKHEKRRMKNDAKTYNK